MRFLFAAKANEKRILTICGFINNYDRLGTRSKKKRASVNDSLVPVFVSGVNSNPSLRRPSITRSVCNLRPDFAATARKNFEKWREPKRLCRFFLADLKVADIVTAPMRNPTSLRTIFASATLFLVLASCATVAQQTAPQIPSQLSFLPSPGTGSRLCAFRPCAHRGRRATERRGTSCATGRTRNTAGTVMRAELEPVRGTRFNLKGLSHSGRLSQRVQPWLSRSWW